MVYASLELGSLSLDWWRAEEDDGEVCGGFWAVWKEMGRSAVREKMGSACNVGYCAWVCGLKVLPPPSGEWRGWFCCEEKATKVECGLLLLVGENGRGLGRGLGYW